MRECALWVLAYVLDHSLTRLPPTPPPPPHPPTPRYARVALQVLTSDAEDVPQEAGQDEAAPGLALVAAFKTSASVNDVCRLLRPLTDSQLRAVLGRFNAENIRVPLAALGDTIDVAGGGYAGGGGYARGEDQYQADLPALAGRLHAVTSLVQRYSCPAVDTFAMSALRFLLGRLEQLICALSGPSAGAKLLSKLRRGCCDAVAIVGRWLSDEVSLPVEAPGSGRGCME